MIYIELTHEIQVAHRLTQLPGKCQNIHGHSMRVRMRLFGIVNPDGYMCDNAMKVLDFGDVKKEFRNYLDSTYDHRLLLNKNDPWAKALQDVDQHNASGKLPGLNKCDADPTTENIALWIHTWAASTFAVSDVEIHVSETSTNGVGCA